MFDVAENVYRLRPLTDQPLDMERLEYRNLHERQAYDLVLRQAAVKITKENRVFGRGIELTGTAKVEEDKREYLPQLMISNEGFVSRAECTCATFRRQGIKSGPCPHLIALRIAHAIREKVRRETGEGDDAITVETKTFSQPDTRPMNGNPSNVAGRNPAHALTRFCSVNCGIKLSANRCNALI